MSENTQNMPGESQNQAQDDGWIEIARAGTFTPSNGKTTTLTRDELDQLAKGFDVNKRRVPLVFGHPKTSAPAYGWVEALQMKGDILQARFSQVHDDVKTLVKNGNFKNISISISPDKRSLMHVGLLGAAAPAIDGLKEVSFAHDTICIDFSMNDAGEIERLKAELAETKERLQQFENVAKSQLWDQLLARIRKTVEEGKVTPAESQEFIAFAEALNNAEIAIQFSANAEPLPAAEAFVEMLEKKPVSPLVIDFSAYARPLHSIESEKGTMPDNPAYLI